MFKALSNPNRLQIFIQLLEDTIMEEGCCTSGPGACSCIGELGRDLGIVPSTLSHHIKELNQAGLIEMERQGQNVLCRVNLNALTLLTQFCTQTELVSKL